MERRQYRNEFKREAARLLIVEGSAVGEVSAKLGVPVATLYQWRKQHLAELAGTAGADGLSLLALAEENAELRKRLAKAERMNEILKKTVGYFSKDV